MKHVIESGFTKVMQGVPAQINLTGDCIVLALAALEAVDFELTASVVVNFNGNKAVVAIPGMGVTNLISSVVSVMESAIVDIPECCGGLWVNLAVPKTLPLEVQKPKIVEEGGYKYWMVRCVLGFGFSHKFSIIEVLIPSEHRQAATGSLYRVQKCFNKVCSGVTPDGVSQVFGSQSAAVAFIYNQDNPAELIGESAKSARDTLSKFAGMARRNLYASAPAVGRRLQYATAMESLATIADVCDISTFSFAYEAAEKAQVAKPAKKSSRPSHQMTQANVVMAE